MILRIDYREKKLLISLQSLLNKDEKYKNCIKLESSNLLLGDICILDNDLREIMIIERKTLTDLESSIKDSRYREQAIRLNHCNLHNHYIMYILEGDRNAYQTYKSEKGLSTLYSAMFSLYYYQGFSILFSQGINDTAEIVFNFCKKISREKGEKSPYYMKKITAENIENNEENNEIIESNVNNDYLQCIKKSKRENINKENIWTIMLMQIPYVSSTIANVILERYNTIPSIIEALRENENCLNDLYTISKEKKRKIPANVISNLKNFLL